MTGLAEGIAWDRLRADEDGPCMAAGCNVPFVAAAVVIDGHRYRLCDEDAELIPGYTPNLLDGSIT
ncbi:hypothetical protein [Nonomuraea diastatica]|uniref:Uncharacterized protein n=1 Tax=Nonomuraea diastatica TaxID=1848329 RepID=A0A4R4VYQ0_9ACTN|nr:hypothetical protein [Nonomuraea diastatica]TDD11299.1 hypothetical protein E1294_45210 [Nonomuraea diastatica]